MRFMSDTVLVVDDEEINRAVACAHLNIAGWKVVEADGGSAALRFLRDHAPAGVLLDIRMPEIDGLAVARQLVAHPERERMRVVAYTAHAIAGELARIRQCRFEEVVVKPASLKQLTSAFPAPPCP